MVAELLVHAWIEKCDWNSTSCEQTISQQKLLNLSLSEEKPKCPGLSLWLLDSGSFKDTRDEIRPTMQTTPTFHTQRWQLFLQHDVQIEYSLV